MSKAKTKGRVEADTKVKTEIKCECGQKLGEANYSKVTETYFCPNCCACINGGLKSAGVKG